jgi:hypothetical protein
MKKKSKKKTGVIAKKVKAKTKKPKPMDYDILESARYYGYEALENPDAVSLFKYLIRTLRDDKTKNTKDLNRYKAFTRALIHPEIHKFTPLEFADFIK